MVNMSTMSNRYTTGTPGIEIIERVGLSNFTQPYRGTAWMLGPLKRGPIGVPIPVMSLESYNRIYGDPGDSLWHLYEKGDYVLPDAVEGFFRTGDGSGILWITRVGNGDSGRSAELTLKNRMGQDCLKITAANPGRWGGGELHLGRLPIVMMTPRTFTVYAPGVQANEYEGGAVAFDSVSGVVPITGNTGANDDGLAVFSVSAQYNLPVLGVKMPPEVGEIDYDLYASVGSVDYDTVTSLTGTAFSVSGATLTGTGSTFTTELGVGDTLLINDEVVASVIAIADDLNATLDYTFPDGYEISTVGFPNVEVSGSGTTFTADFAVGDMFYLMVDGEYEARTVAAVVSDTLLQLETGFEFSVAASTAYKENYRLDFGDSALEPGTVRVGSLLIDPTDFSNLVEVAEVIEDTDASLVVRIQKRFSQTFTAESVYMVAEYGKVSYDPIGIEDEGLSVEIFQGKRYPATHFGLAIYFRGREAIRVDDASLDPSDPFFVEPLVNDFNIAYRTGTENYYSWVTVESLLNDIYTTNAANDMRPANGSGEIRQLQATRLYTDADFFDYGSVENAALYPNPYEFPRGFTRSTGGSAPQVLDGYVSTSGTSVTGISTEFSQVCEVGDYLFDPASGESRKVVSIQGDGAMSLESAFSSDLSNQEVVVLGWIDIDPSQDLSNFASVGDHFTVVFPSRLKGGYDGDVGEISSYEYMRYANPDANILENAVFGLNMGTIRIAVPDVDSIAIQKAFISYCEQKAYEFRATIPLNYNSAILAESFISRDIGRSNNVSVAWPSYAHIQNPLAAGDRLINLCGDIMGGESARAVAYEGWMRPFAGLSARLPRVRKLPYQVNLQNQELINTSGIQPIRTISGNVVVFGARGPASQEVFELLHVSRTQREYIRIFLEASTLMEKLFLPKDPLIIEHLIMTLTSFAQREYAKGAFDRQVNFSSAISIENASQNTGYGAVSLARGRVEIAFSWRPPEIVEVISITCSPQGLTMNAGNRSLYEYARSQG